MGEKISEMYCGDILLKNLQMFTHIHCANLSLVTSQFILINSFILTWALLSWFKQYLIHLFFGIFGSSLTWAMLSWFKQYLIHLFWDVWIFFDSLLFKGANQAEQA